MKKTMSLAVGWATLWILAFVSAAPAQLATSFIYQGMLQENGIPSSGTYQIEFALYDADIGGNQIGISVVVPNVMVTDGLFTVELDFGAAALNGDDRWLEIIVLGQTLIPRQPIRGAPYAIQARGIYVNDSESFAGIGRTSQIYSDEVFGLFSDSGGLGGMYVETVPLGSPYYGYSSGPGVDVFHFVDGYTSDWHLVNGSGIPLTVKNDGFVGVGRVTPVVPGEDLFGVHAVVGPYTYGGMTVSTDDELGRPVYGYAAGGTLDCWTYFDGDLGTWIVNNGAGGGALAVDGAGQVGIGTLFPGFRLEVNGNAAKPGGGSWSNSSDRRLKKNINALKGSLEKLMKLRGISYEYIDPQSINELPGQRIGMIAQEVENVFPDWVEPRKDGYKAVTFRGFEALTVEALRELRDEKDQQIAQVIADKDAEIARLRADHQVHIGELQERMSALELVVAQLAASVEK